MAIQTNGPRVTPRARSLAARLRRPGCHADGRGMPATELLPRGRVNRLGYVDASVCEPRDKSHVRLPRILVMGCCRSLRSRATLRPGARGQLRAESYEPLQSVRGNLFVVSRILRRRRRLVLCLRFVSRLVFLRGSLPLVTLTHLS